MQLLYLIQVVSVKHIVKMIYLLQTRLFIVRFLHNDIVLGWVIHKWQVLLKLPDLPNIHIVCLIIIIITQFSKILTARVQVNYQ